MYLFVRGIIKIKRVFNIIIGNINYDKESILYEIKELHITDTPLV